MGDPHVRSARLLAQKLEADILRVDGGLAPEMTREDQQRLVDHVHALCALVEVSDKITLDAARAKIAAASEPATTKTEAPR